MAHARQLIRDEITSVIDGISFAPLVVKVFNAKILTVDQKDLPAVSVLYTENQGGEEVTESELNPGDNNLEQRELIISVEVMTLKPIAKDSADDADDISQLIEDELHENITLNGKCDSIELFRIRFGSSAEGTGPVRLIENLFRVRYQINKAGV